jgi:Rieske 2Fe-2S family protein
MERCALADKMVLEFDCNWKLLVENIIDIYHFGVLHPTTVGRNIATAGDPVEPRPGGGYFALFNTGTQTKSGEPLFGRMPWLEDQPGGLSVTGLLPPNMTLFAHVDDVHPIVTWPIAPDRSRIIIYILMPTAFFDRPNFKEKVADYAATNKQILEEDRTMIESLQKAVASKRFVPGPMSHLENGVHHVINANLDRIFRA